MTDTVADPLTLDQLPARLRALGDGVSPEAWAVIDEEFGHWRVLHDRLIALIAALVDEGTELGEPLQELLDNVVRRSTIGVKELVGTVDPAAVAQLLRSHGSEGPVVETADEVEFRHECGTGLTLWRRNPDLALVAEGEVRGVPGGVPRYCARCMNTISVFGDAWRVTPPSSPADHCTWTVQKPHAQQGGSTS